MFLKKENFLLFWLWKIGLQSILAFTSKEYINVSSKHPVDGAASFDAYVVRELMQQGTQ
jgi:hypothetical protein